MTTDQHIDINKVGAFCIREKKLLIVHKKTLDLWLSLGGKLEPGESETHCLEREVAEEVGCTVANARKYRDFVGPAHDGKSVIRQAAYFCDLQGDIRLNPRDNIDAFRWVSRDYKQENLKIARQLEEQILPALIAEGYL